MKYGAIALVGKPNVGKSTIINKIFKEEVSIVNQKPQTTRNQIAKIYQDNNYKILFADTPGFHLEQNELDKFLNGEIYRALKLCPVIFVISDLSRPFSNEDEIIANKLAQLEDRDFILLLNKSDLITKNLEATVDNLTNNWKRFLVFKKVFIINQEEFKIDNILNQISDLLEDNEDLINYIEKNLDDKFTIKERIRNILLKTLKQEVPYSVAVKINKEKYNKEKNTYTIQADIIVNKESQKPILIGKNGSMIKKIGIDSRIALAQIYDANINLFLDVKVKENWKNDLNSLKEFGYIIKK